MLLGKQLLRIVDKNSLSQDIHALALLQAYLLLLKNDLLDIGILLVINSCNVVFDGFCKGDVVSGSFLLHSPENDT